MDKKKWVIIEVVLWLVILILNIVPFVFQNNNGDETALRIIIIVLIALNVAVRLFSIFRSRK